MYLFEGRGARTLDDGRDGEGAAQGGVLLAGDTDERLALRAGGLAGRPFTRALLHGIGHTEALMSDWESMMADLGGWWNGRRVMRDAIRRLLLQVWRSAPARRPSLVELAGRKSPGPAICRGLGSEEERATEVCVGQVDER